MLNIIIELVILGFIALIAWLCYLKPETRFATILVFVTICLLGAINILLGGLFLLAWVLFSGKIPLPESSQMLEMPEHLEALGIITIVMGLAAVPVLIPWVRKLLAKSVFPGFQPDSAVHTWALYVFILALMMTGAMVTILYDPQVFIESMAETPLYFSIIMNLIIFSAFSFFCDGVFIRRSLRETARDLGLDKISVATGVKMVFTGLALMLVIHAFEQLVMPFIPPETLKQIQQITESMQTFDGVGETLLAALIIGIGAGISEEILFRGLIQPVFGLIPTSILFALIHVHYGFTVLLLELFFVGVVLGLVRKRYNTTAAIVVHTFFDFFAISSVLVFQS